MRHALRRPVAVGTVLAALALPGLAFAGSSGDYTAAQAAQGKKLYDSNCASCHMTDLSGGSGPALAGKKFKSYLQFSKISADQLLSFIASQMPANDPGSLKQDQYNAILAYMLKYNGYSAGSAKLTTESVKTIKMLPYPG